MALAAIMLDGSNWIRGKVGKCDGQGCPARRVLKSARTVMA
jgi:hypothetical protein